MLKYLPASATPTMRTKWPSAPLKAEALADRFGSVLQLRHQTPHKRLIHNRNRFRLLLVLLGKFTALQNRGPHRLEVVWSNARVHRQRRVLAAFGRLAFNEYVAAVEVETEWDVTGDRRRLDARQRLQTFRLVVGRTVARALRRSLAVRDQTTSSVHFANRTRDSSSATAATCARRVRLRSGPRARSRSGPQPKHCASVLWPRRPGRPCLSKRATRRAASPAMPERDRRSRPQRQTLRARTAARANRHHVERERKIDRGLKGKQQSTIQRARNTPTTPPTNESRMLSVRSCRIKRKRFAPIARRIAISLRRSVARASIKPARFVQVTSKTRPTARHQHPRKTDHCAAQVGKDEIPARRIMIVCPSLVSGYSFASCWANSLSEASACCELTPLLRRPTAKKFFVSRSSIQLAPGSTHSIIEAGNQISGV